MKGRICTMCNQFKEWQEYYLNPTCADGHERKCIPCTKIMKHYYYLERKKKQKGALLPFVYHPRHPIIPPRDPNNLTIEQGKFTHHFQ